MVDLCRVCGFAGEKCSQACFEHYLTKGDCGDFHVVGDGVDVVGGVGVVGNVGSGGGVGGDFE